MGVTSENVAHRFGVTREEQDQAAVSYVGFHKHYISCSNKINNSSKF